METLLRRGQNACSGYREGSLALVHENSIVVYREDGIGEASFECVDIAVVSLTAAGMVAGTRTGSIYVWKADGRQLSSSARVFPQEPVVCVGRTSSFVAGCSRSTVVVLDPSSMQLVSTLSGTSWRACSFNAREDLLIVGSKQVSVWSRGEFSTVDDQGARCAAGFDDAFAFVRDGQLQLFQKKGIATAPAPPPSERLRGRRTFSGFGGGEIPNEFLLRQTQTTIEASPAAAEGAAPTLYLARNGEVVRQTKVAGDDEKSFSFGHIVDLVAAGADAVHVASSFSSVVLTYCAQTLVLLRTTLTDGLLARGIAAVRTTNDRNDVPEPFLLVAARENSENESDAPPPLPFTSSGPRLQTLVRFKRKKRSPPPHEQANSSAETHVVGQDGVEELRAYVDRRLDGLEAKLDRLLERLV